MSPSSRRSGFTLIELLVVIAIIGLLAAAAFLSVSYSAKRSRDARRKADLRQIQKALELYNDDNQTYPSTGGNWYGTCPGASFVVSGVTGAGGYVPSLAPTYIPVLPVDPHPVKKTLPIDCTSLNYGCYIYRSDGASYKIASSCGMEAGYPISQDPFYDQANPSERIALCGGADPVTACGSW